MTNKNFKWISGDIDNTLILKVLYKKDGISKEYGVFNVSDVLDTTGDDLEVETANIDDLTKFLTMGIVRFTNLSDVSDILDIPFRNLYKLYQKGNMLGKDSGEKLIPFSELDTFSVIDGTVRNEMFVFSAIICKPTEELDEVMKIASLFGSYGMQEKIDALNRVTIINHRRIIKDDKERSLRN